MVKTTKNRPTKRARKRLRAQRNSHAPSLLDLPAELCNEIYGLVLTAPYGLRVRRAPGASRNMQKPVMSENGGSEQSINQLKYVNRQLHAETAGLEIRFNTITFNTQKPRAATRRFFQFTLKCAPNKLKWLRNVVIHEKLGKQESYHIEHIKANMKGIIDLFKFAAANPHIAIKYRLPSWNPMTWGYLKSHAAYRFLIHGLVLELLFRDQDNSRLAPEQGDERRKCFDELIFDTMGKHRSSLEAVRMNVPNLRFYPDAAYWREDDFRTDAMRAWQKAALDPLDLPENALKVWVGCVER
jgi:hypothetical protein